MTEDDNVKPKSSRHTTRLELTDPAQSHTAEPEEMVKKPPKRGHRPSVGKKGSILPGHLQKILAAAIVLCLGLAGFIIFIHSPCNPTGINFRHGRSQRYYHLAN
jgi:hypothetical protein